MRQKNPNKFTIDIYSNDADVIDTVRHTDIGTVSYADATHQIIKAYLYCKKNGIDFTKEV